MSFPESYNMNKTYVNGRYCYIWERERERGRERERQRTFAISTILGTKHLVICFWYGKILKSNLLLLIIDSLSVRTSTIASSYHISLSNIYIVRITLWHFTLKRDSANVLCKKKKEKQRETKKKKKKKEGKKGCWPIPVCATQRVLL